MGPVKAQGLLPVAWMVLEGISEFGCGAVVKGTKNLSPQERWQLWTIVKGTVVPFTPDQKALLEPELLEELAKIQIEEGSTLLMEKLIAVGIQKFGQLRAELAAFAAQVNAQRAERDVTPPKPPPPAPDVPAGA